MALATKPPEKDVWVVVRSDGAYARQSHTRSMMVFDDFEMAEYALKLVGSRQFKFKIEPYTLKRRPGLTIMQGPRPYDAKGPPKRKAITNAELARAEEEPA